jgi:hypothetical protein
MSAAKPTTVREWLEANVSGDAETIATEIGDDFKKVRDRLYWMRSQGQAERNDFGAWQLTGAPPVVKADRPMKTARAAKSPAKRVPKVAAPVQAETGYEVLRAANGDVVVLAGESIAARVPAAIVAAIRALP